MVIQICTLSFQPSQLCFQYDFLYILRIIVWARCERVKTSCQGIYIRLIRVALCIGFVVIWEEYMEFPIQLLCSRISDLLGNTTERYLVLRRQLKGRRIKSQLACLIDWRELIDKAYPLEDIIPMILYLHEGGCRFRGRLHRVDHNEELVLAVPAIIRWSSSLGLIATPPSCYCHCWVVVWHIVGKHESLRLGTSKPGGGSKLSVSGVVHVALRIRISAAELRGANCTRVELNSSLGIADIQIY